MEIFFWSYGDLIWGQKWTLTKIDHFTKNGPKSSILSIFQWETVQNDETENFDDFDFDKIEYMTF